MTDPYTNKPAPYINANERFMHGLKPASEPKVDEEVSYVVHREVRVNDMRLVKLVAKWRKNLGADDPNATESLNLMKRPDFIQELKDTFK